MRCEFGCDRFSEDGSRGTQGSGRAMFAASRISRSQRDLLAAFAPRVVLDLDGLGPTLFCHGSPRRDSEIITTATPEQRLREILRGVASA